MVLLALVFVVMLNNPGRIEPIRDANGAVIEGGISEIVRMPIGGVEQGMIIQSEILSSIVK